MANVSDIVVRRLQQHVGSLDPKAVVSHFNNDELMESAQKKMHAGIKLTPEEMHMMSKEHKELAPHGRMMMTSTDIAQNNTETPVVKQSIKVGKIPPSVIKEIPELMKIPAKLSKLSDKLRNK